MIKLDLKRLPNDPPDTVLSLAIETISKHFESLVRLHIGYYPPNVTGFYDRLQPCRSLKSLFMGKFEGCYKRDEIEGSGTDEFRILLRIFPSLDELEINELTPVNRPWLQIISEEILDIQRLAIFGQDVHLTPDINFRSLKVLRISLSMSYESELKNLLLNNSEIELS